VDLRQGGDAASGTITRVDTGDRKVYVDRTKAQIKDAPEFDKDTYTGAEYRDRLGSYYQRTYPA
jgi:hypothetical protein